MRIATPKNILCGMRTVYGKTKKREERARVALPVDFGSGTGVTRDISASGIFFETDESYGVGSEISLSIAFDTPGGKLMMKCQGQIVRVEHRDGKVGVAAKITASMLESAS